ncbi:MULTISPECIES: YIP1 family protein [unclassified Paracoccus (in: a-proteobacteria)]|uniref:YIP1 family protein n=1 Tax=unclassified Paracoccus (in: a-proteobacteria) TaxID=2688777 RepID=UPI0012B25DF7|nr:MULTISPECIES: YIP1 family protein [unclassified Paracoccus (in: a-proteobacteria)]UXU74092.1 YIP1 family protein [Paracoccus sp. SMMA_5]UXU79982.1 YIP1 family protein [Paracoccus sp. SMMA_5_TC]
MTLRELADLVVLTFRDPAAALAVLRRLDLPMSARWMALLLAVTLSALLGRLSLALFPIESDNPLSQLLSNPMSMAGLQLIIIALAALVVTQMGRAFGGHGTFADALLVVAWIELVLLGVQAMQLVVTLLFPTGGAMLSALSFGLFIYLAVTMTKALHGFKSTFLVALGFVAGAFLLGFLLSLLAAALGIFPEVAA